MSDLDDETIFFERHTADEVQKACDQVLPGARLDVVPRMFDAGVIVRHAVGEGPTIAQADRIAEILREGRALVAGKADWHMYGFDDYCDAIDPNVVYGTAFGLRRSFIPTPEALERTSGA